MKNIFKSLLLCCALALCAAPMTSCSKDDDNANSSGAGFKDIDNPIGSNLVSKYGETVTVSFTADAAWDAELVTSDNGTWATINAKTNNTSAGKGSVRMTISQNNTTERSVEVYVTVSGHKRSLLCTLKQAAGSGSSPDMNLALNTYMHNILKDQYLWNTAYKALDEKGGISLDSPYEDFLYTHLTKLGDVNIEDGGLYRAYSSLVGQRYIYSNIQEVTPGSRAVSVTGLGMGPTLSMKIYQDKPTVGLILGYVYPDSPATSAKLQRGDIIYNVNGTEIVSGNYYAMQNTLFYGKTGTYKLKFYRYEWDNDELIMTNKTATVTAGSYTYNPVLLAAFMQSKPGVTPAYNIGYLVLESFDANSHDYLKATLEEFKAKGITDMILDLRFNPGGAVVESRYLMSSIVGSAHYDDTYAKMTFVDGKEQNWTFGYGYTPEPDGFGQGPDLGLKRLYVICSENTASASEIVINSLKGIDFPVTTYGSRTEGKNVGMVSTQISYGGRKFEYSPITFYVKNAKDFGDYADGFAVDHMVNNQNADWSDDIDNYFPYLPADWGDMNDPSFYWALTNCIEGKDPDFTKPSAASKARASMRRTPEIMKNVQIKPIMGRFGSVIYSKETVELKK